MPLADRPDFQAWLKRFEARHEAVHGGGPPTPADRCDGCGDSLEAQISPTGLCIVCLAETYGRDRARVASRVASALRVALAREGDTPIEDVRDAIEEVLAEHERKLIQS